MNFLCSQKIHKKTEIRALCSQLKIHEFFESLNFCIFQIGHFKNVHSELYKTFKLQICTFYGSIYYIFFCWIKISKSISICSVFFIDWSISLDRLDILLDIVSQLQ